MKVPGWTARGFFRRDSQRARIVLPSFLASAELIEHGALGRQYPPIGGVGAMGAASTSKACWKLPLSASARP